MKNDTILLGHGSGGTLSHDLISSLFVRYFQNAFLQKQTDSSLLLAEKEMIAFTTDSFVVDPVFFPGGNIGKLAVCGTVNDLAVSGAQPKYLSASFIIEEGFPLNDLETIVASMAEEALKAGVQIVTGDTKVVNRGKADKLFITTTGIGFLDKQFENISYGTQIIPGDKIILNGSVGNHGMAIMKAREADKFSADIESDCACLNHLIASVTGKGLPVRWMRDATRGGLGTVLAELVKERAFGLEVHEEYIPVKRSVEGMCELIGFDPLYVANEGIVVIVVPETHADEVLQILKADPLGKEASLIGQITGEHQGRALIHTGIGGRRIIDMLAGEQLPRIC